MYVYCLRTVTLSHIYLYVYYSNVYSCDNCVVTFIIHRVYLLVLLQMRSVMLSNKRTWWWWWWCKKGKGRYSSSWEPHLRATGRHLPYGITQCYLPPDTSERTPPYPSRAGRYSIYLSWRDGRLSWPSCLDSAMAGSRTSDLLITSPTPNCSGFIGSLRSLWKSLNFGKKIPGPWKSLKKE